MNAKTKYMGIAAAIGLLLLAAGVAVHTLWSEKPKKPAPAAERKKAKRKPKTARRIETATTQKKNLDQPARINKRDRPRIEAEIDFDDLAKLTEAELELLREIQKGIDANSLRRVAKAVEQIQKLQREKGDNAVAVAVREAAVEALGYFLPESLAELIGFMADSDPDVLDDVMMQFEDAIDNSELGDRELSGIMTSVAKQISHEDALDAIFSGIETDMRNSVAVATYKEILKSGTEAAKQRVWESVEDFTGEEITTEKELDEWLKQNPDDEDDEDLYGPSPLDDDDNDPDD